MVWDPLIPKMFQALLSFYEVNRIRIYLEETQWKGTILKINLKGSHI